MERKKEEEEEKKGGESNRLLLLHFSELEESNKEVKDLIRAASSFLEMITARDKGSHKSDSLHHLLHLLTSSPTSLSFALKASKHLDGFLSKHVLLFRKLLDFNPFLENDNHFLKINLITSPKYYEVHFSRKPMPFLEVMTLWGKEFLEAMQYFQELPYSEFSRNMTTSWILSVCDVHCDLSLKPCLDQHGIPPTPPPPSPPSPSPSSS